MASSEAPSALRNPISRVRSVTETSMTFVTMPLTNREMLLSSQENRYTQSDVIEYIENFFDIADNKVFLVGDIVAQSHEVLHLEGYRQL